MHRNICSQAPGRVKDTRRVMILIGLGANLRSDTHGPPEATLEAALAALEAEGVRVVQLSPWYRSAPVPASDQPSYVNGVAAVESTLAPAQLLALLHRVEARFGRTRATRNEPRVLDLDLLDYHDLVYNGEIILPHPRLQERAFVLLPLRDVAPDWRHPVSRASLAAMIAALPADQAVTLLEMTHSALNYRD
jgi:2-amino-4-hydroxy-6-hydroxymethyldihydropteridine diphosphokinase